jgi:hypothetical protein
MMHKTMLAAIAATGLALASLPTAALAVGPGFPATHPAASPAIEQASFWALPFPYGYNGWRRHPECVRYVPQRDFWGVVHWHRVWICD